MMPFQRMKPDITLRAATAPLIALALLLGATGPASTQTALTTKNLVDGLVGLQTTPNVDVAALRRQALERIKRRADSSPVNRPPIAKMLYDLPQLTVAIQFNFDSAIINPSSYPTLGRIADAMYHPMLLGYRFLVVGHTDATGKREYNLALSQRRADSIREALVTTFRIQPQRILAVGLGEEQLQDAKHPKAAINRRVQIVTIGKIR